MNDKPATAAEGVARYVASLADGRSASDGNMIRAAARIVTLAAKAHPEAIAALLAEALQ